MSDRPIVFHLITRYRDGGAEATTRNEIEALLASDMDYEVLLGTGAEHDPEALAEVERLGVETVVFRTIRHYNPFTAILAVFGVALYLHRHEIDVIHTHSTEAGIIGRLAGWLARTAVVIHEIHGDPMAADRHEHLNQFILWAERITAPMATQIIVKADHIREIYLDRGIGHPDQYRRIYHGVDIEAFADAELAAEVTEIQEPVVLFVGRLVEGKGLIDLLDAVERINLSMTLFVVGDGPLADDLASEIDRRGLPNVELLGHRNDVPSLLAGSDLLVLPSYREGTPRVITEAQAAGVPVVATDIAGIPEQVADGESGLLVSPGDVDALTNTLKRLTGDAVTRERMSEVAVDQVHPFQRDIVDKQIRSLYADLVNARVRNED